MNARKLSLLLLALGAGLVFESSLFAETSAQRKARLAKQKRTKKTKKSAARKGKGKGKGKRAAKKKVPVAAAGDQVLWTRDDFADWTIFDLQDYQGSMQARLQSGELPSGSPENPSNAQKNLGLIESLIAEKQAADRSEAEASIAPAGVQKKANAVVVEATRELEKITKEKYSARKGMALTQASYANVEDFVTKVLDPAGAYAVANEDALKSLLSDFAKELGKEVPEALNSVYNDAAQSGKLVTLKGNATSENKEALDAAWTSARASLEKILGAYQRYFAALKTNPTAVARVVKTNNAGYQMLLRLLARYYVTQEVANRFNTLFGGENFTMFEGTLLELSDDTVVAGLSKEDVVSQVNRESGFAGNIISLK